MSHDKKKVDVYFDTLLTYFENLRPESCIFEPNFHNPDLTDSDKKSLSILQNEQSKEPEI